MVAVIHDPLLEERLIAERRASGGDKHDEVWEDVYVMAPLPNDEHQQLVADFTSILTLVVAWQGNGRVRPGANISDRKEGWEHNYRCPDVVVFMNNTAAENCGTFWYGGPDLAIEIVSPADHTLEKLPFYAKVGTRELLIVDRQPWLLTLYRLQGDQLVEADRSSLDDPRLLVSDIVPLSWRMAVENGSPAIVVEHRDGGQHWTLLG